MIFDIGIGIRYSNIQPESFKMITKHRFCETGTDTALFNSKRILNKILKTSVLNFILL